MLEARIQQQFFDAADLLNQSAEGLGRPLDQASQALVGTLTAGGKVVAAGCDGAHALAQHAATLLVRGAERERPPLAALALADGRAGGTQLQALGHPGDVLLLFVGDRDTSTAGPLIDTAHDKEMTVVVLADAEPARRLDLNETDVLLTLPSTGRMRRLELQLLALHALCGAIDTQLLGEQDFA